MADLDFRILGSLEATRQGEQLALGGAKQRALLAILLINANRVVTTDYLVEALWPARPPGKPLTAIQGYVSALRKMLAREAIVTEPAGYRLPLQAEALDLLRFDALAQKGRSALDQKRAVDAAAALTDALSLFSGAPLADFTYENWALTEIERIQESRCACLEDRIEADLELGLHAELVGELEGFIAEYPLRERFRAQLMLALYRSGRQAEALNAYQQTRTELLEELGIDPTPLLQELHSQILNQDPVLTAPVRQASHRVMRSNVELPTPPSTFIGRDREVEEIAGLLVRDDVRVMTLTGPGGIGKTRLSLRAGERVSGAFSDGVHFCALADFHDAAETLPAVARTLGISVPEAASLRDALEESLVGRNSLLVLDNAEHLLPGIADEVAFLRSIKNGPTLLVSSRERLDLQAEQLYAVPPLDINESVELFGERAHRANPGVDLEQQAVTTLCARLDHLPLAIELAAARSDTYSPAELVRALGERVELVGPRDVDARHRTLSETISWSYELLSPRERRAYEALSVFEGGFTREAAHAVAGVDPMQLDSLTHKSLIRSTETTVGRRFSMLETIREYGVQQLRQHQSYADIQQRRAAYLAELLESIAPDVKNADPLALRKIEHEHANVRAALSWSLDYGAVDVAAALVPLMWHFWYDGGYCADGLAWSLRTLESDTLDSETRAGCLHAAGELARGLGNLELARRLKSDELERLRTIPGREREVARVLGGLAYIAIEAGDLDSASRLSDKEITVLRGLQEGAEDASSPLYESLTSSLYTAGCIAFFRGDFAEARSTFSDTLPRYQAAGDHYGEALSHLMIGQCARRAGQLESSARALLVGFEMTREANARAYFPECLQEVGALLVAVGEPAVAAELLGASERHRRELGTSLWDSADWDRTVATVRDALGPDFLHMWDRGTQLQLERAVDIALEALRA